MLKKPSSLKDLCDSRFASVYDDIGWNTIMNSQLLYLNESVRDVINYLRNEFLLKNGEFSLEL